MTIREVEELTEMTRANVRFYEQEGFISPRRARNGYRDYTEEDIETLKRIKLLRAIHMPLAELKRVHSGEMELDDALKRLTQQLEKEKAETEHSISLSQCICEDGAKYSTLDAAYILMCLIEPLFLSKTGTTPGKWFLGIRVVGEENRLLTYREAAERTACAVFFGMGLSIPVFQLYRLWKSYAKYKNDEYLEWDYPSRIETHNMRPWNIIAYIGACVAVLGVSALENQMSALPKYQGDITVSEFCENYNHYADYYGRNAYKLNEREGWGKTCSDGLVTGTADFSKRPEFVFTEENGVLTGVEFTLKEENVEGVMSTCQTERILAILSFVKAQDSYSAISIKDNQLLKAAVDGRQQNFSSEICGVSVNYVLDYKGHLSADGELFFPDEGETADFCIHLSLKK